MGDTQTLPQLIAVRTPHDTEQMKTIVEDAYDALLRELLAGRWRGGARLREHALAEKLEVSRHAIREAMLRLCEQGVLEKVPGAGCRVVAFDLNYVIELYQLRIALECEAVRLAARRLDPAGQHRLEREVEHMEACVAEARPDWSRVVELDRRFHRLLVEATDNRCLSEAWQRHQMELFAAPRVLGLGEEQLRALHRADAPAILKDHRDILASLSAGDAEESARLLRRHLEAGMKRTIRLFEEKGGAQSEADCRGVNNLTL